MSLWWSSGHHCQVAGCWYFRLDVRSILDASQHHLTCVPEASATLDTTKVIYGMGSFADESCVHIWVPARFRHRSDFSITPVLGLMRQRPLPLPTTAVIVFSRCPGRKVCCSGHLTPQRLSRSERQPSKSPANSSIAARPRPPSAHRRALRVAVHRR